MKELAVSLVIVCFAILDFLAEKWNMPKAHDWAVADSLTIIVGGSTLVYSIFFEKGDNQ